MALLTFLASGESGPAINADNQDLTLSTIAVSPRRFVAVHGRRSIIEGFAEGLEVWAYPLQILKDYQVSFRVRNTTNSISGREILSRIDYEPECITRIYLGPNFVAREKLFVPLNEPGAIVTYSVQSKIPIDIEVSATPVLDLMWPASVGGQSFSWDSSLSAYRLSASAEGITSVVGSPQIIAHDEIVNRTIHGTSAQLAFTLRADDTGTARVFVALDPAHAPDSVALFRRFISDREALEIEASAHYRQLEGRVMKVITPDDQVNRAIAWSEIALDQAWVCSPVLGCGYVAGYGPSRGARRPQYDWFFAGDGMIAADAAVSDGDTAEARNELAFVLRYQDQKSGMIWHELSQSAPMLDWVGKYPYMFVHVDITFQFLNSVGHYIATSGDLQFAQEHWRAIEKAYQYCVSLIDSSTFLPRIPADKEGGNEQEHMSDDLGLSASWVGASSAFALLAKMTGHAGLAEEASRASQSAREAIAHRYWNANDSFWVSGHTSDGQPIMERRGGPPEAISMHLFSHEQDSQILDRLASNSFQTDWGARGVATDSVGYNPDSYASGSIWPVHTASLASLFWSEHRPVTAMALWNTVLPSMSIDSLGHIPEVLSADVYRQQEESVPEQTWSSAGFLESAIHGLLGLQADPIAKKLTFTPRVPAGWKDLSISNVHLADRLIDLRFHRSADEITLRIDNSGDYFDLDFSPELPLGSKLGHANVNHQPIAVTAGGNDQETIAQVSLHVPHGPTELQLAYTGGIWVAIDAVRPILGDPSVGPHVINVRLAGGVLTIDADVPIDRPSRIRLMSRWTMTNASGATLEQTSPETMELTFSANPGASLAYRRATAVIKVGP
jgi:glycogen debranching enzyme